MPLHPSSCAVPIDLSATVGQDDQAPDGLVGLRDRRRGAGGHAVDKPGRGLRAAEDLDQLGTAVRPGWRARRSNKPRCRNERDLGCPQQPKAR